VLSSAGLSNEVLDDDIGRVRAGDAERLHGLEHEQEDIRAQALPVEEA